MDKGMYSITMYNSLYELKVDLHLEISVSNIIYINKEYLFNHVIERKIEDATIRTLDDCAEILVVANHSVYKEHMFTLNDYYTIILLLNNVELNNLYKLTDETISQVAIERIKVVNIFCCASDIIS